MNITGGYIITFADKGQTEQNKKNARTPTIFTATTLSETTSCTRPTKALRAIIELHGEEANEWIGKKVRGNNLSQMIDGGMTKVISPHRYRPRSRRERVGCNSCEAGIRLTLNR